MDRPVTADLVDHRQAVEIGQHPIEHDRVAIVLRNASSAAAPSRHAQLMPYSVQVRAI